MQEIATYYVTLKPTREGGISPIGLNNIAYVSDPAVEEVGIYLNAHDSRIVADETIQNKILDYLKSCGQEKPTNWTEVTEEDYLSNRELNMAVTDQESYNDFSKKDGSGQWLVRYEYTGPNDDKTRSFCSDILGLGRLYTEEEIKNGLSNPEFGNYSIWDYKGSYGCRHVWKRRIYFEDYEDGDVRRVGFVPQVIARLDDREATTLNAYLSKDEKMQVLAPLLIPDKKVFRNDEIGRYNMVFSKETISELRSVAMQRGVFEKKDLFKDTHEGKEAPSYVVEQWLSEDENDKAYSEYGLNVKRNPVGTWFVLSQVTDKTYWEKEIKANKKHAYSIEALMNLSIIKMSKMTEGQVMLPDGEHLINGTIYVVEGGVVVSTKEVTPEQEAVVEEKVEGLSETPIVEEEVKVEETLETVAPVVEEVVPTTTTEEPDRLAKLEADQEALMGEIAKLKAEISAPKTEDVAVAMSDNRPMWKRISDGINAYKQTNN